MDNTTNMCRNKKFSKKVFMSFKELDNYFSDPDLTIQNIDTISIQQFEKDLDSIIDFSKKKMGLYGKIDNYSISIDSNTTEKGERHHLINSSQKIEKFKLCKFFNKLFKKESQLTTKIMIESWNFTEFDDTEKFQVGNLYTIKPVSITYNSTKQDYNYDKQIISEFRIEEANGTIKKLLIVDTIKKGKTKREKYIDDHKINRQHNNFEIRSHRLNRSLMKTFLFHQINKYKTPEYDQNSNLRKKKAVDINNIYNLLSKFNNNDAAGDNHLQVQEIYRMENDSIYVADDYNNFKIDKG